MAADDIRVRAGKSAQTGVGGILGHGIGLVCRLGLLVATAAVAIVIGCGGGGSETEFGQVLAGLAVTRIEDILARPGDYDGKDVALEGRIVQECPTGCWFNIEDATGVAYVDLKPSGLAIPQYTGKNVRVEGRVVVRDSRVMVVGRGVRVL